MGAASPSSHQLLTEGVSKVRVDQLVDPLAHMPKQGYVGYRIVNSQSPRQVGALARRIEG